MKIFSTSNIRLAAGMALASVLLAACALPAPNNTPEPLPTTGGDDMMNAAATNVAATAIAQYTETAIAAQGGGDGGDATATPDPLQPPTQDPNTLPPTQDPNTFPPTAMPPTQDPNTLPTPVPPTAVPPTAEVGQPGMGCSNPYEVKAGDWIYKIARTCNVLPKDIIAANPGINADLIYPGQKLNMPAPGATPVKLCSGTYTIKAGDTLFRLAYNCALTVEELAAKNNLSYPYLLKVGQVINFP